MKETVGSLRAYFIVIAIIIGLAGNIGFVGGLQHLILLAIGLVGIGLSMAYLYIGIALRKLLVESPNLVTGVIIASIAYQIINFLLVNLLGGFQTVLLIQLGIGLLITWYLLSSVKRLSEEERTKR